MTVSSSSLSRIKNASCLPMSPWTKDGGLMDAALICAQCGTSTTGRRFCTTCGAPFAGAPASAAEPFAEEPAASPAQSHTLVFPQPAAERGSAPVAPWLSEDAVAQPPRSRPNVIALALVAALALS